MKKLLSLIVVMCLIATSGAFALNYSGNLGNEATFETMAEARVNGPIVMPQLLNTTQKYASHPVLDGYPGDTTYIYRSADMYGRTAAVRLNTNIVVFAEQHFETKDAAFDYLKGLGLIAIIDEAVGSVVLVTPANGTAFGAADQKNYYALQTAIFAQGATGTVNGERVTFAEPVYYGGYSFYYVIGFDGGATFLNNYIVGALDYAGRIGGMLLVNGDMDRISAVATHVPAYLVNAPEAAVEKYMTANATDAFSIEDGEKATYYNHEFPLQKVITRHGDFDRAELVKDAYYNFFTKVQLAQAILQGLYSASTPYQGYGQDSVPYSLAPRSLMIDNVTADGIYMFTHVEERFSHIKNPQGEYLQTWYEYLPQEVLDGTAPDGSIPLVLTNHGGGDDPRQFVDGNGFLELAGRKRFAMVAPFHQNMGFGKSLEDAEGNVLSLVMPELIKYMLDKYPALDASRVYVTGYSMGAGATMRTIYGDASLFAAAVPMAVGRVVGTADMIKQFEEVDIPFMMTCSEYDLAFLRVFNSAEGTLGNAYYDMLNMWFGFNEMKPLPALDFDKYPITGFSGDTYQYRKLNGEYGNHTWYFNNEAGVPMVAVNYTESLLHALFPDYANLFWDYVHHFSRDLATGEIVYDPYVID